MTDRRRFQEIRYQSADGLWLYARDYPHSADCGLAPLLCLPGLTRDARDFDPLANLLAPERRIIAADFRGRGKSQHAVDPLTYHPLVEMADTIALLDQLKLERVALIGTSRGGLVAMLMAQAHHHRLLGILLNDIGPRLEAAGLLRIRNYLEEPKVLASWDDAVAHLQRHNSGFDSLSAEEWRDFARRIFGHEDDRVSTSYDARLLATFPTAEAIAAGSVGELWDVFAHAKAMPVAVLRGEHSDLLSARTVAEMQISHEGLLAASIAQRGHAPFLNEPDCLAAIGRWLQEVDACFGDGA